MKCVTLSIPLLSTKRLVTRCWHRYVLSKADINNACSLTSGAVNSNTSYRDTQYHKKIYMPAAQKISAGRMLRTPGSKERTTASNCGILLWNSITKFEEWNLPLFIGKR
jgi:hypothetical protein